MGPVFLVHMALSPEPKGLFSPCWMVLRITSVKIHYLHLLLNHGHCILGKKKIMLPGLKRCWTAFLYTADNENLREALTNIQKAATWIFAMQKWEHVDGVGACGQSGSMWTGCCHSGSIWHGADMPLMMLWNWHLQLCSDFQKTWASRAVTE